MTSTTSALPTSAVVKTYTTTDSQGSTYTTTSTSTPSTSSTPSVTVVTTAETVVTTNTDGSVYTTVQTHTTSSTVKPTSSTASPGPTLDARTCPGVGGVYTDPTTGLQYEVTCGADYPGDDLATPHVDDLAACAAACSSYKSNQNVLGGAGCVAASYGAGNNGGNCYLKASVTTVNYGNGGFVAIRLASYHLPGSAASESVSAPTSGPTVTGGESVSTTTSGPTTSIIAPPGADSSATASATSTGPADPVVAAYPCPTYNQQVYIDSSNVQYSMDCAVQYPGNDLPAVHADTLEKCIHACTKYIPTPSVADGKPCIGASWGIGNVGGNCYLKFQIPSDVNNTAFDSFHIYGTGPGLTASVSAGASSTIAAASTTEAAASTTEAAASTTEAAASTTGPAISSDTGVASSTIATTPPKPSTTNPVCPRNNDTLYTNTFGDEWEVQCVRQLDGDNGQPIHADTFIECLDFCSIVTGCVAVTWLPADDARNTNCYPYTTFRFYSATATNPVLYSGVSTKGPTNNPEVNGDLCPTYNTKMYKDYFNATYTIGCDYTFGGQTQSDLLSTQTPSLMACLTYCTLYNTCIGAVFKGDIIPGTSTHNCFLKYGVGSPQAVVGQSYAALNQAAS